MKDTPLHTEPEEIKIGDFPKDTRYHRLFILVSQCNGFPNKETLDEIVSIVKEDFPKLPSPIY